MENDQHSNVYGRGNASPPNRREMDVIINARALLRHSYAKVRNQQTFPKKDRRLADMIFSEALEIVANLTEANELRIEDQREREQRFALQRSALRNLHLLISNIELAHDVLSSLNDSAFDYWAKLAAEVKKQAAGWYKSDTRRAAPTK